jgi:hypothetical protein
MRDAPLDELIRLHKALAHPVRVRILCTRNPSRSQMAEAFLGPPRKNG